MLSRALSLATVMLLIGCLAAAAAQAQATNLEAGKSPSQIFAGTCTACHKSPRGLLKTVPAASLPGFLRQHYTTSREMAAVLALYLIPMARPTPGTSAKDQPKGKDGKEAKPTQEAKPASPPEQLDRLGRRQRSRSCGPGTGQAGSRWRYAAGRARRTATSGWPGRPRRRTPPSPRTVRPRAGGDRAQDGRQAKAEQARQAAVEEPPKMDEPAKGEAAKDDAPPKGDTAKDRAPRTRLQRPRARSPGGQAGR